MSKRIREALAAIVEWYDHDGTDGSIDSIMAEARAALAEPVWRSTDELGSGDFVVAWWRHKTGRISPTATDHSGQSARSARYTHFAPCEPPPFPDNAND